MTPQNPPEENHEPSLPADKREYRLDAPALRLAGFALAAISLLVSCSPAAPHT